MPEVRQLTLHFSGTHDAMLYASIKTKHNEGLRIGAFLYCTTSRRVDVSSLTLRHPSRIDDEGYMKSKLYSIVGD